MDILKKLLDNFFIYKKDDFKLYYEIKDKELELREFINDKLGYNLLINPEFIKLEKIPGKAEIWMGIEEFNTILDYELFILILIFLEEKSKGDQFVLSNLLDFIVQNYSYNKIDWTVYSSRKSLVRALKLASKLKLIFSYEGEENNFIKNREQEILYENTGISKYVIRNFPKEIFNTKNYEDFFNINWDEEDTDTDTEIRHRIYRRLVLSPILYNESKDYSDFNYIKKNHKIIREVFDRFLQWDIEIYKEFALVSLSEFERIKNTFPNNKGITNIILLLNYFISDKLHKEHLVEDEFKGSISIQIKDFIRFLEEFKEIYSSGWLKEFRELSIEKLKNEIIEYLLKYNFIIINDEEIVFLPIFFMLKGKYPESFKGEI